MFTNILDDCPVLSAPAVREITYFMPVPLCNMNKCDYVAKSEQR